MTSTCGPRPATYDYLEPAVKAARAAYETAYEQGRESDVASCSAWFGWHAALKAAAPLIPSAQPNPFPEVPGASTARDEEHFHQIQAARTAMRAARSLQDAAEEIARYAMTLAEGNVAERVVNPNAHRVLRAMAALRQSSASAHLEESLVDAMLADGKGVERRLKSIQDAAHTPTA